MSTFDEIRVGDTIRVTDTHLTARDGSVHTEVFDGVVVTGTSKTSVTSDRYDFYFKPTTRTRTFEIIKRAPIPEPTGLGAVVEVSNSGDGWGPYRFVRTVQGRWTRSDGAVGSDTWSALITNDTIKVLSEGVAL